MRAFRLAAILAVTLVPAPVASFADTWTALQHRELRVDDRSDSPGLPPNFSFPPGFNIFGPDGALGPSSPQGRPGALRRLPDAGKANSAPSAESQPKPAPPKTKAEILDDLFARLSQSGDQDEARGIARAIQRIWMRSGSDTADLLMGRAMTAFGDKKYDLAEQVLGAVVAIDPDWAEGWDKRATVRFFADDYAGAMEDIGHVLAIEPRHFGALAGMGFILEKSGMDKEALQVFRKTLEIYPEQQSIRKVVDGLALKVEGQEL